METIVIILTYNERNNIKNLIEQILTLNPNLEILIIDDNSPDGTRAIIDGLAKKYPRAKVLYRSKKLGMGSAYVCGFKTALEQRFDYALAMDADFSHPPRNPENFIKEIIDYDIIVSSRYVPGR